MLGLTGSQGSATFAFKARKLRVQYAGAIYHVMNRSDHREPIFRSTKDRELFVETLGQALRGRPTGPQVYWGRILSFGQLVLDPACLRGQ
jgi:hypothetical protein